MKFEPIGNKTEEELKKIAKDIFNDKVFTIFQIPEAQRASMCKMVFMPLLFMGPSCPYQISSDDPNYKIYERENKIWEILHKDEEERQFKELYMPSIGLVYAYYVENGNHNTSPRSINGFPIFTSCRFLNPEDTDKLRDYLDEYAKLRETIDNF